MNAEEKERIKKALAEKLTAGVQEFLRNQVATTTVEDVKRVMKDQILEFMAQNELKFVDQPEISCERDPNDPGRVLIKPLNQAARDAFAEYHRQCFVEAIHQRGVKLELEIKT